MEAHAVAAETTEAETTEAEAPETTEAADATAARRSIAIEYLSEFLELFGIDVDTVVSVNLTTSELTVECIGRSPNSFVKPFKYEVTVQDWSALEEDTF